jgi:hypothetical protein
LAVLKLDDGTLGRADDPLALQQSRGIERLGIALQTLSKFITVHSAIIASSLAPL